MSAQILKVDFRKRRVLSALPQEIPCPSCWAKPLEVCVMEYGGHTIQRTDFCDARYESVGQPPRDVSPECHDDREECRQRQCEIAEQVRLALDDVVRFFGRHDDHPKEGA